VVNSEAEALKVTMGFLGKGLEGSVIKDKTLGFRNCTSNKQLKVKLEIEGTFKITGFTKGTAGLPESKLLVLLCLRQMMG